MQTGPARKRRKKGETASRVVSAFRLNPKLTSVQMGALLGFNPAYVRKVLQRHGLKLSNPRCKLSRAKAREVRALKGKMSQRRIAAKYGVDRSTIGDIHRGEAWRVP
jgi:transposase